jgi:hypothetical protein
MLCVCLDVFKYSLFHSTMNTLTDIGAISFLILTILISGKFCFIIFKHISEKAPIDQTIIDFIYRECILFIHLLTASLSIAVISCLVSEGFALDDELALLLANPIFFFICSAAVLLTISIHRPRFRGSRNSTPRHRWRSHDKDSMDLRFSFLFYTVIWPIGSEEFASEFDNPGNFRWKEFCSSKNENWSKYFHLPCHTIHGRNSQHCNDYSKKFDIQKIF